MMKVFQIPILIDNYVFIIVCLKTKLAVMIDPGRPQAVLEFFKNQDFQPIAIWQTHHHWDHVEGIEDILKVYPDLEVYGSDYDYQKKRIPKITHALKEGDSVQVGDLNFEVLEIPEHTLGHIAFYNHEALFCGDTLFRGGCGRLFEGTPYQMYKSLQKLINLNGKIKFYCTHEYTKKNLEFALSVDPNNKDLQSFYNDVCKLREQGLSTIPGILENEKKWNPFLRVDEVTVRKSLNMLEAKSEDVFAKLRAKKDEF